MTSLNLKPKLFLRVVIPCLVLLCLTNISCSQPADDQTAKTESGTATEAERKSEAAVEEKPEEEKKPVATPFELEPLPDGDGEDGGFSISQVMQLAHDNRLFRQILKDEVDPKCAERLVTLYDSLRFTNRCLHKRLLGEIPSCGKVVRTSYWKRPRI